MTTSLNARARACPSRAFTITQDVAAYQRIVDRLIEAGPHEDAAVPIPVLATRHPPRLPSPDAGAPFDPAGVVFVVDGSEYEPFGRLLAGMTRRSLRTIGSVAAAVAEGNADGPATIVAAPSEVRQVDLAKVPAVAGISVLTARDAPAMSHLVGRLLTLPARRELRTLAVSWDGNDGPGGAAGDRLWGPEATVAALRERMRESLDLLSVVTVGRSCSLYLADGMICGQRHDGLGWSVDTTSRHHTSCQLGRGCYRFGWGPERMLYAHELNARIVLVNSCRGLQLSDGELSANVSVGLSVLDGDAVAYFGSLYKSRQLPYLYPLLRHLLTRGTTLGDAVALLNEAVEDDAYAYGRLCLIGDAGLALAEGPGDHSPPKFEIDEDLPAGVPPVLADREVACGDLLGTRPAAGTSGIRSSIIDALDEYVLSGVLIGHQPDERTLEELREARRLAGTTPTAAAAIVDAIQTRFVSGLVDTTLENYFHFDFFVPRDGHIRAGTPTTCHNCGRHSITHRFNYPHGELREQVVCFCPVCAEFFEGHPIDECAVVFSGPETVYTDEEFACTLDLVVTADRPVHIAIGGALRFGAFYQCPARAEVADTVQPGQRLSLTIRGTLPADAPPNDLHSLKFFCLVNGKLSILSKRIWLSVRSVENGSPVRDERKGR